LKKRPSRSRWQFLPSIDPFFVAVAIYLVACLTLGGGTREGFVSDVALQSLAVPLLLWASWRLLDVPTPDGGRRGRTALVVCLLIAALPLAHLVPLPPSVWMLLPGRSDFETSLNAAGLEVGWLPLSLAPSLTWLSGLALLPPMALFLGVMQLGYADRRRLSFVILLVGMVSVGLGLLQVAQGPTSPLRFYAFTNTSEAVGFFAYRNHYSALLYCLVLIAAAFAVAAVADFARAGLALKSTRSTPHVIAALASFTVLFILVGAQVMARSRAGLGLTVVALLGAFALAYLAPTGATGLQLSARAGHATRGATRLLVAAISLAVLFGVQFALYRVMHRFQFDALSDARLPFARNTIEAAIAYMPFGAGMGTFVPVYQAFEKASDNVASAYANHTHNDFLELWLEGGLIGLVAMILFVVWVLSASWRVWRRGLPGAGHLDNLLACAAVLALMLLLAHAAVDYALRAAALIGMFAWAVAMAIAPVGRQEAQPGVRASSAGEGRQGRSGSPTRRRAEAGAMTGHDQSDEAQSRRFVPAPPREDWPETWQPRKDRKPSDD
jgi:O-antigen ligase